LFDDELQEANTERQSTAAQTNQKYAIACSVILFLLSMIVVFLHTKPVLSSIIVGTKIEGGIILIMLCFWSALVAVVSDTRHGLATDPTGGISNGNLYYFTWAGLAVGVALMLNYIRSVYGLDISAELKTRSKRLQYWVYLGIAGIIQMGSSARVFDNHCGLSNYGLGEQELGSVKFCRRCKVGIVLGVFNAIGSLIVALLLIFVLKGGRGGGSSGRKIPWLFTTEIVMSSLLCLCQAVGVPFLTSQEGPGASINNIFYSSWACLAMLLVLMASWVQDWSAASSAVRSADTNGNGSAYNEAERVELREQTVPIRSNGTSGGLV
jgi:hypothetical protein